MQTQQATWRGRLELGVQAWLAAFKACSETAYWPDLSCHTTLEITPWQQFSPRQDWRQRSELAAMEGC